jgi:hypothetical protein
LTITINNIHNLNLTPIELKVDNSFCHFYPLNRKAAVVGVVFIFGIGVSSAG